MRTPPAPTAYVRELEAKVHTLTAALAAKERELVMIGKVIGLAGFSSVTDVARHIARSEEMLKVSERAIKGLLDAQNPDNDPPCHALYCPICAADTVARNALTELAGRREEG